MPSLNESILVALRDILSDERPYRSLIFYNIDGNMSDFAISDVSAHRNEILFQLDYNVTRESGLYQTLLCSW